MVSRQSGLIAHREKPIKPDSSASHRLPKGQYTAQARGEIMGEIDRCIRRAPADHTMSLVIGHNTQLWRLHTLRPTRTALSVAPARLSARGHKSSRSRRSSSRRGRGSTPRDSDSRPSVDARRHPRSKRPAINSTRSTRQSKRSIHLISTLASDVSRPKRLGVPTATSSTSKCSSALGGMTGGAPRAP